VVCDGVHWALLFKACRSFQNLWQHMRRFGCVNQRNKTLRLCKLHENNVSQIAAT
jgi:hypothetical protein